MPLGLGGCLWSTSGPVGAWWQQRAPMGAGRDACARQMLPCAVLRARFPKALWSPPARAKPPP